MKAVKTYAVRVDADRAKAALDAAGVLSLIVSDAGRGVEGVRLMVPDELAAHALAIIDAALRPARRDD